MLGTRDHRRDSAGMTYVYPVISRRAGGVSLGINLNPNNACNWACIYCQVPNLTRGGPPAIDLGLLEHELRTFLEPAALADFMARQVPPEARRLMDVAFSGNGEPTSAAEFPAAVDVVGRLLAELGLPADLKLRLITNGSLLHRPVVQAGIAALAALGGEVWFKLDRGTAAGMLAVNKTAMEPAKVLANLLACAGLATTWVQTCWFASDGQAPGAVEERAYLDLLAQARSAIGGVHLYGLARPSCQPEAGRLAALPDQALEALAKKITELGIRVVVSA
jgi:hypothetical protein